MKKSILFLVAVALMGCQAGKTDALLTEQGELTHFPYCRHGIRVEKITKVTPVDEVPGLKIVETQYVNKGNPITVTGYEMLRIQVKAQDSVVWTLQPSSTSGRLDWVLPIKQGFQKQNYLGMNNSDYGGGIPVLDIWQRNGGIVIGLIDSVLRTISMPIEWPYFSKNIKACLRYDFTVPVQLAKGDTLTTFKHFVYTHKGDFFNALRTYSNYMQEEGFVTMQPSEPQAFEPVWCAWGYERTFTLDEVIGTLDKAAELGFTWVDVDDGYQIAEGDWETNERFPGGDKDMRRLTKEIHKRGMKAKLWWAPLAADPGTQCLKEHPEMLLITKDEAPEYITWWDSYYLSPVNPVTVAYTQDLVDMFLRRWNFDGLKIDGQHLNCCMPDAHLEDPQSSQTQLPSFFEAIYDTARALKPNAVVQICPCGCAVNYYLLPTFNQAVASDPTSSCQVRMKRKAYAAMAPQLAYYGDHVELTDGGCDFASQIGVGAVIGTKFTYPKDNPNVKESFLLTPEKEALIRHWMPIYKEKQLSTGEYLNLYTWGYDIPEGHVIKQNDAMYYAFYADHFEGKIELRGLEKNKEFTITEYAAQTPKTYTVNGSDPYVEVAFDGSYLIEVK